MQPTSIDTNLLSKLEASHSPRGIQRLLSRTLNIETLSNWIFNILNSTEDDIRVLAKNSFRHSNGFQRLVIAMTDDKGPKVRIHLWKPTQGTTQIHSHSWDFASFIISGTITVDCFDVREAKKGSYREVIAFNKDALRQGEKNFLSTVAVEATRISETSYQSGQCYCFPAGEFHSVRIENNRPCLSVVFQGAHRRSSSSILTSTAVNPSLPVTAYTRREYLEALTSVLSIVKESSTQLSPFTLL